MMVRIREPLSCPQLETRTERWLVVLPGTDTPVRPPRAPPAMSPPKPPTYEPPPLPSVAPGGDPPTRCTHRSPKRPRLR